VHKEPEPSRNYNSQNSFLCFISNQNNMRGLRPFVVVIITTIVIFYRYIRAAIQRDRTVVYSHKDNSGNFVSSFAKAFVDPRSTFIVM